MDDENIERLLEGFEAHQREQKEKEREGKKASEEEPKKQLSEAQTKALLAELDQKQREELCHVLKAQSDGEKDIRISPELARILHRFQRRAFSGHGNSGEETWPMYLGIVLFIVISIVFTVIYFQEQRAFELEELERDEDNYWLLREFGS
eukprot:TRINITY_DN69938_c0_g1_i1.p1 TRINITY_DN69938_c0_g1~~TRINITY_DN69938_c0_g1_i1.p1  ORF type:complete len:150 (-),score=57.46 TRINITY_DN69938_c0_g1_i1:53-502(-)